MRSRSIAPLALLGMLPALAHAQTGVDADFARLVPADAVLVVRLTSVEELLPAVERMRAALAPAAKSWTPHDLLAALDIPASASLIDPKAPLGFALAVSPERRVATPAFILGSPDPEALVASLGPPWRERAKVAGGYVGVALAGNYATGEGAAALLEGLPSGLLVARVDIQGLIEAYRPLIDLGLMQGESMLATPQGPGPLDVRNFMQSLFELALDFLDSAMRLDVALDVRGSRAKLAASLLTREGSALACWGRSEDVDFEFLARRLDPDAAIQFLSTFNTSGYASQVLDVYRAILDFGLASGKVTARLHEAGAAALEVLKEVQGDLGPTALSSFDIGNTGVRGSFQYASPSPQVLVERLDGLFRLPALDRVGILPGQAQPVEIAGVKVLRRVASFDLDAFANALPEAARPPEEQLLEVQECLDRLLPQGLQIALGATKPASGGASGWAVCVAGGDEAYLRTTLERLSSTSATPDPGFAPALAALKGANPGAIFRYDIPRVLAGMEWATAALHPQEQGLNLAERLKGMSCRLTGWAGIDGRLWKAGLSVDLDDLARFARAMASN
jgi:hypothetical protein